MERRKAYSFRTLYMIMHVVNYIIFLSSDGIFKRSFLSDFPFLAYVISFIYFISINLYVEVIKHDSFYTPDPENPVTGRNLKYCEICQSYTPIRACHCRDCNRCVLRRDHHCPWTNMCIGRNNHAYFYLYTITEGIIDTICIAIIADQLWHTPFDSSYIKNTWKSIFLIPWAGFGAYSGIVLFIQHTDLMLKNITVWEYLRWGKITYLAHSQFKHSPFNKGWKGNIIEFFTMAKNKKEWDDPLTNTHGLSENKA